MKTVIVYKEIKNVQKVLWASPFLPFIHTDLINKQQ